jgi:hypothetical protein
MAKTKRLFSAVDKFSQAMKDRLSEKAEEGFKGWNNKDDVPTHELINRVVEKVDNIIEQWITRRSISKKDIVDIGNFAMMLHRRC